MKKKLLCWALAVLTLICSMPLSVFAEELGDLAASLGKTGASTDAKDGLPVVTVTSMYVYDTEDPNQFRALPDDDGTFYLEIALSKAPATSEEILVYYRTVDDTAVAKWGDYEGVGDYEDISVSLNPSNGYRARVVIKSTVMDYATYVDGDSKKVQSRRFLFQLTRVDGKAVLSEDTAKREVYCYLSAEQYVEQKKVNDEFRTDIIWKFATHIRTDFIYGKGETSQNINFRFDDYARSLMATGKYDLGISVVGRCVETFYQNDGPTTFDLYYTYQGVKRKALTLIVEGEFDDSNFFGWEHAYDYAYDLVNTSGTYKGMYRDEECLLHYKRSGQAESIYYDIEDFIDDNFYGFILYDNNGNVAYQVTKDKSRDVSYIKNALRQSRIDGYAILPRWGRQTPVGSLAENVCMMVNDLNYLRLPSNFAFADSYSFTFGSDGESDEARKLDDVGIAVRIIEKDELKIARNEEGDQLVTTNIDQLREGDPLRLMIRFDRFAKRATSRAEQITATINGQYPVTFNQAGGQYYDDTLVFECVIPEELKDVNITSITNILLSASPVTFVTGQTLVSLRINDIRGFSKDTRVPVATVNPKSNESFVKSRPLDLSVHPQGNGMASFNDFVTVYYQWSDSAKLPETYSQKIVFHTAADGEKLKTIIGTGNGTKYLHLKTVSVYGKSSISDSINGVYDPSDTSATYTPFGPFNFDNLPPVFSDEAVKVEGSLKDRIISIPIPRDTGIGVQNVSLYGIPKGSANGEGVLLKSWQYSPTETQPEKLTHTISHKEVGVGWDAEKQEIFFDRAKIQFYWVVTDHLGNTTGRVGDFELVFDTNNYLYDEIEAAGPHHAIFDGATKPLEGDDLAYIYDYKNGQGKLSVTESGQVYYYGFSFKIKDTAFDGNDQGQYSAEVSYKGAPLTADTDFVLTKSDNLYVVWFLKEMPSGRYDIQLVRTEGGGTEGESTGPSVRKSQVYTVYATNGESDNTAVKDKITTGTLLNNTVYQLSAQYPYFYYKNAGGEAKNEYYNGTRKPATFSSFSKAKEYVYFMELGDIYLIKLTAEQASALTGNNGASGYMKADGETMTPQKDQYWVRYKSASWTPTSGDSAWVYYYYGVDGKLSEDSFSSNLRNALDTVTNRITEYGKQVVLTDDSLFLGSATGEKMLDKFGMPYLQEGQIHYGMESANVTKSGSTWSSDVFYTGDKNIYHSVVQISGGNTESVEEFPIIGYFKLSDVLADDSYSYSYSSRFYYKTRDEYRASGQWKLLDIGRDSSFFETFTSSGVYYIREISRDGVAVYSFYVDKEAPTVSFTNTDDAGLPNRIPVDGVVILDITTKDLTIGAVDAVEIDRLSYVAIYKVANLAPVGVYTADMLETEAVKLPDGNYYIVVSDRSGNHYTVTAKISSNAMECQIKETTDKFIKLTCNRKEDEILRYEVYLNGELVTSTYAAEQTFDKAGLYTIYVQDIYGNVFTKDYTFTRNYPTVTWKYYGEDGKYHAYDPTVATIGGFSMTAVSDNQYKISTSVKTRFSFSGDYVYEFIGAAPKYNETISTETVVTIEEGQSFSLRVSYKNHSDCYSTYSAIVDVTPPSINVLAEEDVVANGEFALFDKWLESGKENDVILPEEFYFLLSEKGRTVLSSGDTVSSDLIQIEASDANDLALLEVYLNGNRIRQQDTSTGFSQITVGQWGDYRVVAKDTLGNVAEFTFTNGRPEGLEYFVDGAQKELDFHGYLNFETVDGKHVYTKVDYGNTEFRLDLKKNADVFLSVGVSGGQTEIRGFRIQNGQIFPLTYKILKDENGAKFVDLAVGDPVLDMNAEGFKLQAEHKITGEGSYPIYASIDADQMVSLKVHASEDTEQIVSVSARVEFIGSHTVFVSSEMSGKKSNVHFKEQGIQSNAHIRINSGFTIDESFFESEGVESVRLYFSKLNDLDVNALEGKADIYASSTTYTDEGFFLLIVRNRYGNETVYKITSSSSFGITASVQFGDGHKIHYSRDYAEKLYSNGEITLDILDEDVSYRVTLNGTAYNGFVQKQVEGITYYVFTEAGVYDVQLTDAYGNVITRQMEINKSAYTVPNGLLTGFNDKALKRDEGYTNQKLSIDKTVYDSAQVYYLAIRYGDGLKVIYDAFAEEIVPADEQAFVDLIGSDGDGVYTLICRNRYGAVVTQDIHYRGTPTLRLERTTRSHSEPELYDLNYALSLGFWSNNTLTFHTDATTYVFKINGSVTECPRTLVFEHAGDYGSSEYEIAYVDEYGFEYAFKAYLVRKEVTVTVPDSITGLEIDGILNTQNDISITFEDTVYATYTLDNGEEMLYHSGEVLKKDGTYRFTVMDYAGNTAKMTLKKDTIVEFEFYESNTSAIIQNGGVVNTSKIGFRVLNKDSAYIEKVMIDGVVQTDFEGSKFTGNGKCEVILRDKLGNTAYYSFYIITRAQNGFAYTTPYEYHITEMWYDSGDGVKVSYLNFVNHDEYTSSFDFTENGTYTVVMTSIKTGVASTFEFRVNTNAPEVTLVGCADGETTINDVSLEGYKVGDRIKIYLLTKTGEELIHDIEITSPATQIPVISEGGSYRIVVESEAGVPIELSFVRKHVMNTAGSVFIMVMIGLAVIGLFTGLVYRNKSKTDD